MTMEITQEEGKMFVSELVTFFSAQRSVWSLLNVESVISVVIKSSVHSHHLLDRQHDSN